MCKMCEAMDEHKRNPYVSPYPPSGDILSRMSMTEVRYLTKTLIERIVASSRESDEQARLARTGQTRLF